MRRYRFVTCTAVLAVGLATRPTWPQSPVGTAFTYQGQLKEQGIPLNGDVDLWFSLFDVESGGGALDELDVVSVAVVNGLFTVELDFGASVFNGDARWLEVSVRSPHDPTNTEPFTTLSPRQLLTATPYALQTRGLFVNDGGNIGIGTLWPNYPLHVKSDGDHALFAAADSAEGTAVFGLGSAQSGANSGVFGKTSSVNGHGVYGWATATTGMNYGVYGESWSDSGTGVYGSSSALSGTNYGVQGSSGSDSGLGVYGFASASSGYTTGVKGRAQSNTGTGVYGWAWSPTGATFGVRGKSDSDSGTGVLGLASAAAGTNYGVYGETASPDGYAGYFTGGRNYFEGHVGIGTELPSYPLDVQGSGDRTISAINSSAGGHALYGQCNGGVGGWFQADGTGGVGVIGVAGAVTGTTYGGRFESYSTSGYAVRAVAAANSGTNYGVYGESQSPNGYAGYFKGDRSCFIDGRVGIGTDSPAYRLHVELTGDRAIYARNNSSSGAAVYGHASRANGTNHAIHGEANSPDGYAGYFEGGRNYFEGNVGIGTTEPSAETALHVSGASNNFGVLVDSSGAAGSEIGLHSSAAGYASMVKNAFYSDGWNRFDDEQGAFLQEVEPDGNVRFRVASPGTGAIGWTTALSMNTDGEIGIGTTEPFTQLQVETDNIDAIFAKTTDSGGWAVRGLATSTTGTARGGSFDSQASEGTGVYGRASALFGTTYGVRGETTSADGYAGYFQGGRNYFEGRVGIGTTSPGTDVKLQLGGADANIRLRESGGNPYVELGDTSTAKGYLQWFSSTNRLLLYASAHAYPVAIGRTDLGGLFVDTETNDSNVGIGTESPQFKLHVAGSAGKPGGGSWSNSSDHRLKKNISDLDGSLDRLMRLRGVSFEYIDPKAINELEGERIGMIAQEVEEVLPDWVDEGGHGYKTVTYRGFEALTVEALRELREERHRQLGELRQEKNRQLAEKDDEIRELRTRSTDLESRVAQLEALVAQLATPGVSKQ